MLETRNDHQSDVTLGGSNSAPGAQKPLTSPPRSTIASRAAPFISPRRSDARLRRHPIRLSHLLTAAVLLSATLTLSTPASAQDAGGICDRAQSVQDALLDAIPGVDQCENVTSAHLADVIALMRSAAVANAIEKVTASGGQPHRCAIDTGCGSDSGVDYSSVSITHDIGYRDHGERLIHAIPWRGDDGQLHFAFRVIPETLETRGLNVFTWTNLSTADLFDDISGHTTSHSPIEDHGLGPQWQGVEGVKAYNGGGTLTVRFFTDLDAADDPLPPYTDWSSATPEGEILLTDNRVPDLTGRDGIYFAIPDDGLKGTLDGIAGTFTCPDGYCSLVTSWERPGYTPWDDSALLLFTPDDDTSRSKFIPPSGPVSPSTEVPKENYLSFGSWLYVPEIGADPDDFRFGVFAGGDDAFAGANLTGLTGTAIYAGKATGMYAEKLHTDTFTADVDFTADFGSASELGRISGSVSSFALGSGKPSPLDELVLMGNGPDDPNIFPGWPGDEGSISGGFVGGAAHSDDGWYGGWDAKFYGNAVPGRDDIDPTAHPTSFAGAFAVTNGDAHIAGSFGTHKQ